VAERNADDLKKILHKLKGTAGTAGLIRLAEIVVNWESKTDPNVDFILRTGDDPGNINGTQYNKNFNTIKNKNYVNSDC
jgi:HPt (histidine-containing phosphotransfer) domain-containing protein